MFVKQPAPADNRKGLVDVLEFDRGVPVHVVAARVHDKKPPSVSPEGFPATYKIELGDLLSFPAPTEQSDHAEAAREQWECGGERRFCGRGRDLDRFKIMRFECW